MKQRRRREREEHGEREHDLRARAVDAVGHRPVRDRQDDERQDRSAPNVAKVNCVAARTRWIVDMMRPRCRVNVRAPSQQSATTPKRSGMSIGL